MLIESQIVNTLLYVEKWFLGRNNVLLLVNLLT